MTAKIVEALVLIVKVKVVVILINIIMKDVIITIDIIEEVEA